MSPHLKRYKRQIRDYPCRRGRDQGWDGEGNFVRDMQYEYLVDRVLWLFRIANEELQLFRIANEELWPFRIANKNYGNLE